jgi:phosphoribosylanthranilate isomerase
MFLKICGITRLEDALCAVQHGATAVGFVVWPRSPRAVSPERVAEIISALPPKVLTVGVFVNETVDGIRAVVEQSGIDVVQLHGDEPPAYADAFGVPVLRSTTLADAAATAIAWPVNTTLLLDAADRDRRGGTGTRVDWPAAAVLARQHRFLLAGGLTPENVADAIAAVRPFGVDVSSGVEAAPGVKDVNKVARFLANARRAFDEATAGARSGER